jgi:hypothetical protein
MWHRNGLAVVLATLASVGFTACSSSSNGIGLTSPEGATSAGGTLSAGGVPAVGGAASTGETMSAGGTPGASGAVSTGGTTSGGGTATGGCKELADIAVCIDGSDWLHIQGTTGWFTHGSYDAPGTHPDCAALGMLGVVTVNGSNTPLTWSNGDGTGQPSSTFTLPLPVPTVDGTLLLTPVQARDGLSVTANPASENGYEGVIFIDDSAISGAAVYDFEISWCIGTGAVTGAGGATGASGTGGATGSIGSHCTNVCPNGVTPSAYPLCQCPTCSNFCTGGVTPTYPLCQCPTCSNFCIGGGTPTYPLCQCPRCSNFCTGGGTPTYPLCTCPTPICTRTCPPGQFLNSISCTCS